MTKKRKIPAGKMPVDLQQVGRSLENEVLSLALERGKTWHQPTQGRLRQRHREVTQAQADELDQRCRKAMGASFAIVAKVVEEGGDVVQASGRILESFPWIDTANLDHICSQGYFLAK
jgi:hypothetical protein